MMDAFLALLFQFASINSEGQNEQIIVSPGFIGIKMDVLMVLERECDEGLLLINYTMNRS